VKLAMSLIANTLQDPSIPTCALRHCRVDELPGSRQVVIERIANGKLHRSHLHAQELANQGTLLTTFF